MKNVSVLLPGLILVLLLQGCVTQVSYPSASPKPATVKLGTFANVELLPVTVAEPFTSGQSNQKAAEQITERLMTRMTTVFPAMNAPEKKPGETLVIKPLIKEIRFVGRAARIWVGSFAGSSAILMEVTYLNKETGAVVARGEFYNHASGMVGGFILNAADLMMLDRIAAQVVNYSAENR